MLRLSRRLSDRFHVIRYDRRGYGRSAGVGPPFTVADNVDDLERLVEERTEGRGVPLAFGHSFGGNIVLALAAAPPRPRRARRGLREPAVVARLVARARPPAAPRSRATAIRADAGGGVHAPAGRRREVGRGCRRRPERPGAPRARRCSASSATSGSAHRGTVHRIAQPVLAMAGERARPHHRHGDRGVAVDAARLSGSSRSPAPATSGRTRTPTRCSAAIVRLPRGSLDVRRLSR